jgi:hypothetical protein
MMTITPREVNDRFRLLNMPFNSYCKQNFIDFNFVVDQILQMSLPYSEGNKQLYEHSVTSIDQISNQRDNTVSESQLQVPKIENSSLSNTNKINTAGCNNNNYIFKDQQQSDLGNMNNNINLQSQEAMKQNINSQMGLAANVSKPHLHNECI